MDDIDRQALRLCAATCWTRRDDLNLSSEQRQQVLVAWMAIGDDREAEAASETLHAVRASESKQIQFDALLGGSR